MHHAQGELVYRSDGHVGEVCDDGNNCTEYTYDDLGRPETITDPLGNTSSFVYSPGGMLLSSTDANGVTTSYAHDAAGQTTGVSYSDGVTHPVTYDYDADGRLLVMTDTSGSSTFTYDSLGRVKREVTGLSMEADYAYDRLDHVTSMAAELDAHGGVHVRRRGAHGFGDRPARAIRPTFSYDASSNLVRTLFPGGDVDRDGYDNAGRLVHYSLSDSTSDPASIDIAYKRNLLGQITSATQTGTGQPSQAYGYDANGRLSRKANAAVNYVPEVFDESDNFLQNAAGNTFTYDAANRLVSEDQKDITPDSTGSSATTTTAAGRAPSPSTAPGARTSYGTPRGTSPRSRTAQHRRPTPTTAWAGECRRSSGGTSHRYIWDSRSQVWSSLRGVWGTGPSDVSIFGAIGQDARLARTALRGRAVVQGNAAAKTPVKWGSAVALRACGRQHDLHLWPGRPARRADRRLGRGALLPPRPARLDPRRHRRDRPHRRRSLPTTSSATGTTTRAR